MSYNLKNARNGKSISKMPKWPSLRALAVKSNSILHISFIVAGKQDLALKQQFPYKSSPVFLKFKLSKIELIL